ncbi:MAG: SprT family zinc-dependent metalloprotease [Longimicrobiales bacterium]|nr:SprT family zinc-dependent metalloprotease [Longimicrobiales bacterium]
MTERGLVSDVSQRAAEELAAWPPLERDLVRIRLEDRRHRTRAAGFGVGPCCATPLQIEYLRKLYLYLNRSRFGGRLPARVPIRLSNRMTTRLGQMVPGEIDGRRRVLEIALNVDLMLAGNGRIRLDTLVHEMAHAADWIFDGQVGHGPTWKGWAFRSGCEVTTCCTARIRRRRRGEGVTRVPPLPRGG